MLRKSWPGAARCVAKLALAFTAMLGGASAHGQSALTLVPAHFEQLGGWRDDKVAGALLPFLRSCARIAPQPDAAPLDPQTTASDFGRVRDWRPLCREAAALPPGDEGAARRFFEARFLPVLVKSGGASTGRITAYWEVETTGSRVRQGAYQIPVYRKPPELAALGRPLTRQAIEQGAIAGRGLEVLYLNGQDQLVELQRQGSGRVRLTDGSGVRLIYEANNGAPTAGSMPPYVFFREGMGDGPIGAEGAVLTPGRSLSVDHRFIPLGIPLWLEARDRASGTDIRRLVVAQDTGDGIEGPVRGDLFWGSGPAAQAAGSRFLADGGYYLLLPRGIAARLVASR